MLAGTWARGQDPRHELYPQSNTQHNRPGRGRLGRRDTPGRRGKADTRSRIPVGRRVAGRGAGWQLERRPDDAARRGHGCAEVACTGQRGTGNATHGRMTQTRLPGRAGPCRKLKPCSHWLSRCMHRRHQTLAHSGDSTHPEKCWELAALHSSAAMTATEPLRQPGTPCHGWHDPQAPPCTLPRRCPPP